MQTALITGITGQDGSYLAELLLEKGYRVVGMMRRSSRKNTHRIAQILSHQNLHLVEGDLLDSASLREVIRTYHPDEIYNLAAMSHVQSSFSMPEYTMQVNAIGVLRLLDMIRDEAPGARLYQASTSELFGKAMQVPQHEMTQFYPRSPYGISKLAAFWHIVNYREAYKIYACNGILFNHESPRRGEEFVSRKITLSACRIVHGKQERLYLGNLDAVRDWGYAQDFVKGMWQMLQQETAEDFVLATGRGHTVRQFVEMAFDCLGTALVWQGTGVLEKGIDAQTGRTLVEVSPHFFRPAEVSILLGDSSKAKRILGWEAKTRLEELIDLMIQSDLEAFSCL